jgi:ABC-2 type transport system ATP-binding protein
LTETPSLDERLTGRDNLRFYANLFGVPKAELDRRVDELLTTFDLADRGGDKVASYSKGMKQRLALARAILHKPDLLFLDEPTSGLDPLAARHVHDMVRRMVSADGGTVFLTTHNLVEAQRLCDRVGVMEHGVLVALGKPHELARRLVRNLTIEIEIEPDDRAKAFSALQAGPGKLVEGQRNGTVVVKGAEREAIPELIGRLVSAEVRIYEVIPQEPSLEDVYFALHGEETSA